MLETIEAEAPELAGQVAWLRRRFFAAGVALEDLTPGFEYSAGRRVARRPALAVVLKP